MNLRVIFSESTQTFNADITEEHNTFKADMGEVQRVTEYIGGDKYLGAYEVTPRVEPQILPTAMKVLEHDINIQAIPYAVVTNHAQGKTVTIG